MSLARVQNVLTTVGSGFKPLDISNEIRKIRPAQSTLLTLCMGLNKLAVDSRTFKVNEQDIDAGTVTLTDVDAGTGVVTMSADDIKLVRLGQTIRLDHSVVKYVTVVDYGAGTATLNSVSGLADGDVVVLGSAASEELSSRPTPITRIPVQVENFVETLRDAYGQSRFVRTEKHYGGPRQFHNRETCLWEHKRFIDRGLWFNAKAEATQNTQKVYKTNGVLSSITSNVREFGSGTVSWDKIRANITTDTRFSLSPSLWLCVPRKGLEIIETIIRNKAVPATYDDATEIKVMKIGMGNKMLKIVEIDHFEAGLADTWCLLDPEMLEIVTCRDQETKTRQWMIEQKFNGNDTTGTDGDIGEILTDFGLRLNNEKAHAIWHNAGAIAT